MKTKNVIKNIKKDCNSYVNNLTEHLKLMPVLIDNEINNGKIELITAIAKDFDLDYDQLYAKYIGKTVNTTKKRSKNTKKNSPKSSTEEENTETEEENKNPLMKKVIISGMTCYIDKHCNKIYDENIKEIGEVKDDKYHMYDSNVI